MNLSTIIQNGGISLLVILSLVQVSPIKINPWSAIAKWFGHAFNGEVLERLEQVEKNLDKHITDSDMEKARRSRQRILRFADDIASGLRFSKEHWDDSLRDIDYYETYCREHPDYPNNKAVMAIDFIKNEYKKQFIN